jgi:transposase
MNEELRHEIIRRFHEGQSQRGIGRDLNIGRTRVARVLAEHEQAREGPQPISTLGRPPARRGSLLDDYREAMGDLLARYPHITAVRMFEELQARGFAGKYSTVRNHLRKLRPRPTRPLVERFETGPGKQAQMDYAQYDLDFVLDGRRRVYLFSYILAWSRRQYLCFTESQDFATTIRQHVRAFEHLGGVAATCLYDNMKVVVSRYEDDQPIYNTRFLAFATHYGYRPAACRPYRPETKGKVERPFHYVETNLLNARTFQSLEHLNDCTRRWLAEVADVRVHRRTNRRPIDLHAEEQPHLIPLPANPYDVAEVVYRSVDAEGFVTYRQNQYSVPWRYVGQVLPLRVTEEELIVYGLDLEELARHRLLPGRAMRERQVLDEHRPPDNRRQQDELLRESFAEFGEIGIRFWTGLVQAHRQSKAQARKILALRAQYHQRDLLAALERAVMYGAYACSAVERILSVQAEPKTTLETLADQEQQHLRALLKGNSVRPREMAEYQKLLFEESSTDGKETTPAEPDHQPCTPTSFSSSAAGADPGELPHAEDSSDGPAVG